MSQNKDKKALEHVPHELANQSPKDNPPETKLAADELVDAQKPEGAPEKLGRKAAGMTRGKVWEHGDIHHDGNVYAAGSTADLPEEFAEQLGKAFVAE